MLIDGGNAHFHDTRREGALNGPSTRSAARPRP